MEMTPTLQAELDRLNPEQREAVEHLDGPLLVIAGPGTGKTQLLSLRAANILITRDAAPDNVLCLTYTDAGAEAMRRRLVELIGRDAYGIHVSTFHGFASSVRARYAEHFERRPSDRLITALCQREIMDELLRRRPFGDVLSAPGKDGAAYYTDAMLGFVSKVKRSGISYGTLAKIAEQNIAAASWLEANTALCDLAARRANEDVAHQFEEEVEHACALIPEELAQPVVSTPGTYVPFPLHLCDTVRRTELVDAAGKTAGYTSVRNAFFDGSNASGRSLKVKKASEGLLAACEVASRYQAELDRRHLYDYDDMISDFVQTVEADTELGQILRDTYTYLQIDEFQDTNGAQMRIVELLCEGTNSPNIMAVGDDDQAIMRFQGASIECIDQFVSAYRPYSIVLKTNYRSTPQVVELGQKVAAQIERRLEAGSGKQTEAACPPNDQTELTELVYNSKAVEYAALARSIRERIEGGYIETCDKPDEAIAVISPKHAVLRALIPHLVAENVPFAYRQTQSLFTSERMQTILALARCVAALSQGRTELAASYLPQIVCAAELGGNHAASVRFALEARRTHHGDWLQAMRSTSNPRIRSLCGLIEAWAAKAPSSPVRDLLFDMSARPLAYYRSQADSDPLATAEFNAGMRALLDFVEGELAMNAGLDRALRLTDVIERLDAAQRHRVDIEAGIDLDAPNAVRLVSAHGSKGLEFDCVYLVDADDATWHKGASGGSLYPANLLMGDERDEDDARRLLFVAFTRAKRHVKLFRAEGQTIRELSGLVTTVEVDSEAGGLDRALETTWRDSYRLDTPELRELVDTSRDIRHLSASALNAFVTYQEGCENSSAFPDRHVMRLPERPQIALEFGTIVHAMMEDISNRVIGPQACPLDTVLETYRQKIAWMDFETADVARYAQRFDRICASFVPWLTEFASGYRRVTEVCLQALTPAGTPLFGFLDLLLIDDEAKTVRIVDYKTGLKHEIPDGYERQLRFYKMLVESSPQFEGYTVISMGDYYVEPDKDTSELHPPFATTASDEEIHRLEQLADAVWARMQTGAWDTGAFELSELYEEARDAQQSLRLKRDKTRVMQRSYETWLIEEGGRNR